MTVGAGAFRLLIVDDEQEIAERLESMLEEDLVDLGAITFEIEQDFDEAERRLKDEQFDLIILDVRDSSQGGATDAIEGRGRELYERIKKTRWVPVIFFTGVPEQVRHLTAPPLVEVVAKNRLEQITEAVRAGLSSGVPSLTRRLGELVDQQMRSFLRDVIAPQWEQMAETDQREIAPVLVHRLAAWLKENAIQELDGVIATSGGVTVGHSSAARVYLKPPVTRHLTAADLLRDAEGQWWLVLTPACDLYEDLPNVAKPRTAKAGYVRLAKADPVTESPLAVASQASGLNKDRDAFKAAFGPDHNRFRALPKYLDIPNLMVDFENVTSVQLEDLRIWLSEEGDWTRVATLDSPFAEAMLTGHSRAVGRIGTPDINWQGLHEELGISKGKKQAEAQSVVPSAHVIARDPLKEQIPSPTPAPMERDGHEV